MISKASESRAFSSSSYRLKAGADASVRSLRGHKDRTAAPQCVLQRRVRLCWTGGSAVWWLRYSRRMRAFRSPQAEAGKLSGFTDLAITVSLFCRRKTQLQALNPNLAEASDFSLRIHMRDRFMPPLLDYFRSMGGCESPASNISLCYGESEVGRASRRHLRRSHGTECCHPEDKGPGLGCSCHRKGEGRAAV